jgi:hypothetical protein
MLLFKRRSGSVLLRSKYHVIQNRLLILWLVYREDLLWIGIQILVRIGRLLCMLYGSRTGKLSEDFKSCWYSNIYGELFGFKAESACGFHSFYFIELCTCLAWVHHYELLQCGDLGAGATVNHLVMRCRLPSYALSTRSPGTTGTHPRICSRHCQWLHDLNVKFAILVFTDDWESPLNFCGESFQCISHSSAPSILCFMVNNWIISLSQLLFHPPKYDSGNVVYLSRKLDTCWA